MGISYLLRDKSGTIDDPVALRAFYTRISRSPNFKPRLGNPESLSGEWPEVLQRYVTIPDEHDRP